MAFTHPGNKQPSIASANPDDHEYESYNGCMTLTSLQTLMNTTNGTIIFCSSNVPGGAHRDERDTKKGFNCVVPYGEWEGGDLLLWEIRQRNSVRQGQAVFLRGSIISHNAWDIRGVRNCVDLFTHENVLRKDLEKRKHDRSEITAV